MKSKIAFVLLGIFLGLAFSLLIISQESSAAQDGPTSLEGKKPYTPSRLEWLAVAMNASFRDKSSGYSIGFVPLDEKDTIKILIQSTATAPRDEMDMIVKNAHENIMTIARKHGWDTWLKITDEYKQIPTPRTRIKPL